MSSRPYQKLIAWKKAHELCLWSYRMTACFPVDERYRLTSQICRAAYSVPMNLAEGNAKQSRKEKAHFFSISMASLEELHYQFYLAKDLGYISMEDFDAFENLQRFASAIITKLRSSFV